MKRIAWVAALSIGCWPVAAQDVLMESDSEDEVLLKVENTGESYKTGIDVSGVGLGVMAVATGYYSKGVWGQGDLAGVKGEGEVGVQGYGTYTGIEASADYGGTGVYAYAPGGYAAYLDGDVVVNGDCDPCSPSDSKFKRNIQPLEGGLQKVMALHPKSYEMRVEEFKGKVNFTPGTKYGLIAEEVATVMPEIVHSAKTPPPKDSRGAYVKNGERIEFKSISYTKLIPVMLQAMQEQQAMIEALRTEVAALKR